MICASVFFISPSLSLSLPLARVCIAALEAALVYEALVTYPLDFHIVVESRQSASRSRRQDKLYRHFVQLEAESKFRGCGGGGGIDGNVETC